MKLPNFKIISALIEERIEEQEKYLLKCKNTLNCNHDWNYVNNTDSYDYSINDSYFKCKKCDLWSSYDGLKIQISSK